MTADPRKVEIVTEALKPRLHVWDKRYTFSPTWECCSVCGIVRRADDRNAPCKGPARITLRTDTQESAP